MLNRRCTLCCYKKYDLCDFHALQNFLPSIFLRFLLSSYLAVHCTCRRLPCHLTSVSETYTLGRPSHDEGSARSRDLFLHYIQTSVPRWDSNLQSQQASDSRSARLPVSAIKILSGISTNYWICIQNWIVFYHIYLVLPRCHFLFWIFEKNLT